MQTIYLDISNRGVVPAVYAKQGDVGRKFIVVLSDAGVNYTPPTGSVFSVWYNGDSGEGNYTEIGDKSAFVVSKNTVQVEMISQMLTCPGIGDLCLVLNSQNGNQIASWNIPYIVESVPGFDSEEAKSYYTAFSKAVSDLPYPDKTLSISGKAADSEATGSALAAKVDNTTLTTELAKKAPSGYGLGGGATKVAHSLEELDNFIESGWYGLSCTGTTINNVLFNYASVFVSKHGNFGFQDLYVANRTCILRRAYNGTSWGDWEIDNPPMELGKEYRTTERFNDEPVYRKIVSYTNTETIGDATTSKDILIPHGITNLKKIISCAANRDTHHLLPYPTTAGGDTGVTLVNTAVISLRITKDSWGAGTWYFDLKYTKTS